MDTIDDSKHTHTPRQVCRLGMAFQTHGKDAAARVCYRGSTRAASSRIKQRCSQSRITSAMCIHLPSSTLNHTTLAISSACATQLTAHFRQAQNLLPKCYANGRKRGPQTRNSRELLVRTSSYNAAHTYSTLLFFVGAVTLRAYLEEAAACENDGVVWQGGVGDDEVLLGRLQRLHQRVVGIVQYLYKWNRVGEDRAPTSTPNTC